MSTDTKYRNPGIGDRSPWGRIDSAKVLADGIVSVSTPGHGGIHLSPALNAAMPEAFRNKDRWYEEDCEWALVALIYPKAFSADVQDSAHRTVKNWMPDAYEAWSGTTLQPGESREKDKRDFLRAHSTDWVVRSAFGRWHDAVPEGWVGVYATPGATHLESGASAPTQCFLVPQDEYDTRHQDGGYFVCDPVRHPVWDPKMPKGEQSLEVVADPSDEDAVPGGPRP